ncbi:gp53-like domain-containing protein [Sphingomonas panni]|uniref:gp53-like domain-containing protein n=1 Tax=Sphingomonas panni TaxID=237612 RepID=UPI001F5B7D39|nr:hypothetical protein [Sphingomonas panni]
MPPLVLTLTDAGIAALRAASGTNAIVIAQLGLSARAIVAAPTLTVLPDEHRRLSTLSGAAVDDRTIHLTALDDSDATYTVRAIGLYLATGVLFAVYAQPDPIFEKARVATYLQAIDLRLQAGEAGVIRFGDSNFLYPPATQSSRGVAEIATETEVDAATDDTRIVTPLGLARRIARLLIGATQLEADGGARTDRYLTPFSIRPLLDRVTAIFARRINTDGLALGGQSLATDVTISVPPATAEQLRNASAGNVAVTPASFGGLGNVIAPTGSYVLPGGLVGKWGGQRGRANSEITVRIDFAQRFPNGCFRVLLTPRIASANASDDYFCQLVGDPDATGFTVQYQSDDANGGLDGFDWLAIGF